MDRVRRLELSRVDLRACNTGKRPDTLRQLQYFFNADLCCAPDSWDTFGPLPSPVLTRDPALWRRFMAKHPAAIMVDSGKERFSLAYKIVAGEAKVILEAIATSTTAVDLWAKNHLPPKTSAGGAIAYHGLTQDLKTVIFAGEPRYRERLVAVTDGKDATVTTNDGLPRPQNAF
jgi:hypothetical protein